MTNLPGHLIADLRYPIAYPDLDAGQLFQWSSLPMIELSALDTYQFVKSILPHPAQRIVEVGCGNGYLCLELARDGHEVLGIDVSPDIVQVAERSSAAHPHPPGFGSLRYLCADVNTWQASEASFDCVIFNRSLHHLPALQHTMEKVQRLCWLLVASISKNWPVRTPHAVSCSLPIPQRKSTIASMHLLIFTKGEWTLCKEFSRSSRG